MTASRPAAKGAAVLFVCLGNICRSPLAEAAFRAEAARIGLVVEVDSAGTGNWHRGEPPDPRACAVAKRHGIDIRSYRARQVTRADFRRFTHLVALDRQKSRGAKGNAASGRHGRAAACCLTTLLAEKARRWPIPITAARPSSKRHGAM